MSNRARGVGLVRRFAASPHPGAGQQGAQARPVPLRLCCSTRPSLTRLLLAQDQARRAPRPSAHRAGTATLRRPRHAARRHLAPPSRHPMLDGRHRGTPVAHIASTASVAQRTTQAATPNASTISPPSINAIPVGMNRCTFMTLPEASPWTRTPTTACFASHAYANR